MPSTTAQFSTDYLTEEQMHAALVALPAVLQSLLGKSVVTASYGWACKIHYKLMFQPMPVGTSWMHYFIRDSLDQRIVTPGESDFRFEVPEGRLEVLFCHESDIHLNGSDEPLLRRFMEAPPYRQFTWHTREEMIQPNVEPPA